MARETGLEPATSGVTGRRSNQLSYSRVRVKGRGDVGLKGATFPSQGCCRSPCLPEPFAIPLQKRPIWDGLSAGQAAWSVLSPNRLRIAAPSIPRPLLTTAAPNRAKKAAGPAAMTLEYLAAMDRELSKKRPEGIPSRGPGVALFVVGSGRILIPPAPRFACDFCFSVQPHRDRALPALCRHRHPVGSVVPDQPLHREAEESRP